MPIYEYKCSNCGNRCEYLQMVDDIPMLRCPKCGYNKLQRCVSLMSFRLKGEGWYETDKKKQQQVKDKGVENKADEKKDKKDDKSQIKKDKEDTNTRSDKSD